MLIFKGPVYRCTYSEEIEAFKIENIGNKTSLVINEDNLFTVIEALMEWKNANKNK